MKTNLSPRNEIIISLAISLFLVFVLGLYPYFIGTSSIPKYLVELVGVLFWGIIIYFLIRLLVVIKNKNMTAFKVLTVLPLVVIFGLTALIFSDQGNVSISYYDRVTNRDNSGIGLGFGPCEATDLALDKKVTFVFTEPFPSLTDYEKASIIKSVDTDSGEASLFLAPGKYGLYMIDEHGKEVLYGDLKLDNPSNNIPRGTQGPWYVFVNLVNSNFVFKEPFPC